LTSGHFHSRLLSCSSRESAPAAYILPVVRQYRKRGRAGRHTQAAGVVNSGCPSQHVHLQHTCCLRSGSIISGGHSQTAGTELQGCMHMPYWQETVCLLTVPSWYSCLHSPGML
jgi:hypothetical protein